jgi:hypothetical protein
MWLFLGINAMAQPCFERPRLTKTPRWLFKNEIISETFGCVVQWKEVVDENGLGAVVRLKS